MRRELDIHGLSSQFRRIVDIPFDVCVAAVESWQRTGQDGELHLGQGLLRGPIERDRDSGTCRVQVRLARRPLRPPLLMRLDIDRLSSSRTVLELIPCKRARPTAGYFRAGHRLLDSFAEYDGRNGATDNGEQDARTTPHGRVPAA